MPTPLDILLDPITLLVLGLYAGLMAWEALAPGRTLPRVRGHVLKSMASFAAYVMLSSYLPLWWDGAFAEYQLLDLSPLGVWGATAAGLMVYELGAWLYHRSIHRFDALWRVHQIHHSSARLDTYSAFLFHPLDMVGWTAVGSACLVLVVGLPAQAATNILVLLTFLAIFQHANVRTPRWLGYLVQRPEQHTIHHGRGIHAHNYADLPIVDLLLGTFENPAGYGPQTGFEGDRGERLGDMLLLRDVHADRRAPQEPRRSSGEASQIAA